MHRLSPSRSRGQMRSVSEDEVEWNRPGEGAARSVKYIRAERVHQDTKTHKHTRSAASVLEISVFLWALLPPRNSRPSYSVLSYQSPTRVFPLTLLLRRLSTDELAGERPHSLPVLICAICLAYAIALALHRPVAREMTKYSIAYWHPVLPWKQDAKVDINLQKLRLVFEMEPVADRWTLVLLRKSEVCWCGAAEDSGEALCTLSSWQRHLSERRHLQRKAMTFFSVCILFCVFYEMEFVGGSNTAVRV